MVLLHGTQKGWIIAQYDVECAYLQAEVLGRSLLLRMPVVSPPGKAPGEVVAATGSIYGTKGAPRKWYFHLRDTLGKIGIKESALERGFYRLIHKGELIMTIHAHVDDLLVAFKTSSSHAKMTLEK